MGSIASTLGSVAGGAIGSAILPGVGTSVGAGLGGALGNAVGGSSTNAAGGPSGNFLQQAFGTSPQIYSKNPGWVNDAQQQNYATAAAAASQPYQPYTGQQVAGTTSNQQAAATNAAQQLGRFAPTYSSITNYLNQSAAPITSTYKPTAVNANNVSTNDFTTADISAYMNPYTQASLQPQIDDLNQQYATEQNQLNGNAAGTGNFGGSRQALLNSQLAKQNQEAVSNVTAQGYNTAYNDAQNAYETDQARNLQGQTTNQAANLNASEFNQNQNAAAYNTNYNTAVGNRNALTTAASGLNGLVNTQEGVTNSIDNQLMATGQTQQTTNQNTDTTNYQNYLNQLYYPEQQASYLNGLLNTGGANSLAAQQGVTGNNGASTATNDLFGNSGLLSGLFGGSGITGGSSEDEIESALGSAGY